MDGEQMMLVYEHKTKGRKLVPNGISIMSEVDIVMAISANPDVRMVKKAIEPGQTTIDIYKAGLFTDEQKTIARANVGEQKYTEEVPWKCWLGSELEGHSFDELTILTL